MSDQDYSAKLLSPEETAATLRHLGRPIPQHHTKAFLNGGMALEGSFELVARDAESQEVEWQHGQKNLICDTGRRFNSYNTFGSGMYIGFCASKETPSPFRNSLLTDNFQLFSTPTGSPTVNTSTLTKQFGTYTFGAPASNRTLGTIMLMRGDFSVYGGPMYLAAYATLSPSRVQTTTQTLEVIYKISMTPIY